MKTKSILKKTMTYVLTVIIALSMSVTVFASGDNYDFTNQSDFAEAFQEMGLSLEIPVASHSTDITLFDINTAPHIGKLSDDEPARIITEADVDILLAFARTITDDQGGFSWDTSVDVALSDAGLVDYWKAGFRQITQEAREESLRSLTLNYTVDELSEMGLLDRLGTDELTESRDPGNEPFLSSNANIAGVYNGTVPSMTLSSTWLSSYRLLAGDSISYTITHQYDMNQYAGGISNLATGVGRSGSQGLRLPQEYPSGSNRSTVSGTINMTSQVGDYFGVMCTGATPIILSGSFQVSW